MLVEGVFFEQLLHGQVHAVVPEVVRVRGHVDTLGMRVCQPHFLVYRQPVLQRQNHPHRGRVHVLVHDELGYLRRHLLWRFAPPAHLLVVELLRYRAVFFPPCAQRIRVVRTRGAYAQVRRVGGVSKVHRRVFRHALNLQTQYLQSVHHVRHASGHHTQVLAAAEHVRRVDECRQLPHRALPPEIRVATEEIVVVDIHQHALLVVVQLVERVALIDTDTRVQHLRIALVLHEQYLAVQVNHAVAQVLTLLFAQPCCLPRRVVCYQVVEVTLHLHLRVKLLGEVIHIPVVRAQETLFGYLRVVAEHIAEEVRADIRLHHAVPIEAYAHVPKVLRRVG